MPASRAEWEQRTRYPEARDDKRTNGARVIACPNLHSDTAAGGTVAVWFV
jgi:hypothetical protein